jgi:hypothetical protein
VRVFLDANILFSGAMPGSQTGWLLKALFRHAECVTSAYAITEARRNLESKARRGLERLEPLVAKCIVIAEVPIEVPGVDLNPKDAPIFGGAIVAGATHLLTGDERDFGKFFGKTIHGVKVVSPRLLAEEMARLGWLEED